MSTNGDDTLDNNNLSNLEDNDDKSTEENTPTQSDQQTTEQPSNEMEDEMTEQTKEYTEEQTMEEPSDQSTEEPTDIEPNQIIANGLRSWPERVLVTGPGLSGGVLGVTLVFNIDGRKGGPGRLTAHCTGAKKAAFCELVDHDDGTFTLYARPEEGGNHTLYVKYEDEPVTGSPFTFPVTVSGPDASKVRVTGPGVENGILSAFNSRFTVDTQGAGSGNVSIRMQGPRGAYLMEMVRASYYDRKIQCHYNPKCPGVFTVLVKWSGVDVPGSPFHVNIYDSEREMERDQHKLML